MADGVSGAVVVQPQVGVSRRRGTAAGVGTAIPLMVQGSSCPTADASEITTAQRRQLADRRAGFLGSVHSWELVTAVDGPGTRMTLFRNGCPLRCQYCHNPDTLKIKDGQWQTVDAVVERLNRYRKVFQATGGGITISGGEPLFQPEFTRRVLRAAKKLGIHTCIDTSGFLGAKCDDDMLNDIDLVLLDVKSGLPDIYQEVTERKLTPTIEFGDRLAIAKKAVWIRFVLVPGLTDSVENVDAVAQLVSGWPNVQRVEVLPFHNMGVDKWNELGLKYKLAATQPPSPELVERVREQFRSYGMDVY